MAHSVLLSADTLDTPLIVFLSAAYVVEVWQEKEKYYYKLTPKNPDTYEEETNAGSD